MKPRLGTRRWIGSWPPSNETRIDVRRTSWPFMPRVDVLPLPEPMPRPTRFFFLRAPSGGLRL